MERIACGQGPRTEAPATWHIELADFPRIESALLHELDLAFFQDRFPTASGANERLLLRIATRSGDRLTAADLRAAVGDVPNINERLHPLALGLLYRPTGGSYGLRPAPAWQLPIPLSQNHNDHGFCDLRRTAQDPQAPAPARPHRDAELLRKRSSAAR